MLDDSLFEVLFHPSLEVLFVSRIALPRAMKSRCAKTLQLSEGSASAGESSGDCSKSSIRLFIQAMVFVVDLSHRTRTLFGHFAREIDFEKR